MGGPSSEREISFKSGRAVLEALKDIGLDAIEIDIHTDDICGNLASLRNSKIDCAFIALHGYFGEDGKIQGILDELKIPYTGSGASGCRLAMDKISSHKIFQENGLKPPRFKILTRAFDKKELASLEKELGFPLVVKPANHGSSIGLSIIDKEDELEDALNIAFNFDHNILIEEYIPGREITVGILDELALPVIEIIPKNRFFDYESKYSTGATQYIIPAKLEEKLTQHVQAVALKAHKLLGCFGCSRVDFILDKENNPIVLEINAIPGFTATSLLPKAAKTIGIDFPELCLKLIELAYEKK
jgi:D-alanine--D-alanine ligase